MQSMINLEVKDTATLTSKVAAMPIQLKEVSEDGTFEGYASTFNNRDRGDDVVMPGAFSRTLAGRNLSAIKMLRDHDTRKVVGKWLELREDERGLYAKGKLFADGDDAVMLAKETLRLMREGALDAMSIGYRTIKSANDESTNVRKLMELELWEISIVTFPMNEMAMVNAVKSDELTARDIERILREGGAPHEFAKLVTIHGFAGAQKRLGSHREGGSSGATIAEIIRETNAKMKGIASA